MKKLLLLLVICGCTLIACNDKKEDDEPTAKPYDFSKITSIPEEEVVKMAANYVTIIQKNPEKCIQHINMDGAELKKILYETKTIKLIAAADLKSNDITAIIQLVKGGSPEYYNINSFFKPGQPGMRGKPPICPPPDACGLPLVKESVKSTFISEKDADAMAKLYITLVQANPKIAIQQITMDGDLLYTLLYKTKAMQLIAAADLKTKEPTAIVQFWRGSNYIYLDIKNVFTSCMPAMLFKAALCPPPDSCRFYIPADSSILIPNIN